MKKYRHELKFIINKNMAEILKNRLSLVMKTDINGENGYSIRSLYFDNYHNEAYYEKVAGVLNRKKYRIRIYNYSDSIIKLECKHKENNMTYKRSVTISKEICDKLILGYANIETNIDLLKEVLIEIKTNNLKPAIIVDYNRFAFTYPISDVRITFDSEISTGYNNFNLFDKKQNNIAMIDDENVVLEVKYNEILPSYIDLILQSVPMYRQAVSKFVMCRKIKE